MAGTGRDVRVVVADDHAPTRAGIRAALEADGFDVCAEATTGAEAVELARRHRPDVALLDVHMPGTDGIRATRHIVRDLPETRVVILTYSAADEHLFAALRAGASGYLLKETDPARLGAALRGVLAGEAALPRSLMARVLRRFRRTGAQGEPAQQAWRSRLTSRELEVAELLRHGASTTAIARRLLLSPTTVRVHIGHIVRKLDARDRDDAIRLLNED